MQEVDSAFLEIGFHRRVRDVRHRIGSGELTWKRCAIFLLGLRKFWPLGHDELVIFPNRSPEQRLIDLGSSFWSNLQFFCSVSLALLLDSPKEDCFSRWAAERSMGPAPAVWRDRYNEKRRPGAGIVPGSGTLSICSNEDQTH